MRPVMTIVKRLSTVFAFTPFTYPDPFSEARQAAYRYNRRIPGPDEDPNGWVSLEPIEVRGTVFSARTIDAILKVSSLS